MVFSVLRSICRWVLSQASIFTLGIMPYISASIVIQLMTAVVPYFQRLKKEGAEGNKKIIQLTRYGTVILLFFNLLVWCILGALRHLVLKISLF